MSDKIIKNSSSKNSAARKGASTKKLRFLTMVGVCIGVVIVQGSMISSTQGIGMGGMAFIAAMLVAFVIAQFNAMSFSELSLMFPNEGTLATYTQKAIGHFPAIVSVFSGYVVVAALAIPVEMFLVDAMLEQLFPSSSLGRAAPLLILLVLVVTNLIGADVFAKVQNLLVLILVSALLIVGLTAITGGDAPHPELTGTLVNWGFEDVLNGSFISYVALAMWLMVGVEFICPMINDVNAPHKNIPRAMHWSLFLILIIFLLFAYGSTLYLNVETLTQSPIPYLDYVNAVFGKSGLAIATIMGVAATCSTMNTVLASVPKMLHGMAEQKQAFPQLKAKNRFDAPWVGILMMAVLIAIPYIVLDIDSLITLVIAATTCWLLAYTVAHIDVLVLRMRFPDLNRPYKTPFYPIPQILGVIAMVYVMLNNSPSPEMTSTVFSITGGILLLISVIAAVWVKCYMKRGLFEADID